MTFRSCWVWYWEFAWVATCADMAPAKASAAKTLPIFMCFMISAAGLEEWIANLQAADGTAMLQILREETPHPAASAELTISES